MCDHVWTVVGAWRGEGMPGCEAPLEMVCRNCPERRRIACGTSRSSKCVPCSIVYRQRVSRVAGSGLVVGRRGGFVTLTAPGARRHRRYDGQWCPCTPPEGTDLAEWNATAGKRFNRFVQDLSRYMGAQIITYDDAGRRREQLGLAYFKAAEVQRRGALHFHLLMRRKDGQPFAIRRKKLRRIAMRHGFGHSVDVQALSEGHATYVAKYVSKAANERQDVPWRREVLRPERDTVVMQQVVDQITNRVVHDVGDVVHHDAVREIVRRASYRTWSASRVWGDTMSLVRASQQHFVMTLDALPCWVDRAIPEVWGRVLAGVPPRPDGAVG